MSPFFELVCGITTKASIRPLDRTLLKNSRSSGPASQVHLQERGELLSNRRQPLAPFSNLTKVERHYRIDEPACQKSSFLTLRDCERRNDRNTLSSPHHRDLRIEVVKYQTRLVQDVYFCEMPIYKLLQRKG